MGMMDTSTKFESRIRRKKVVLYNCRRCPDYVFYSGWGHYCHHYKRPRTEIPDITTIPDWCPLVDA